MVQRALGFNCVDPEAYSDNLIAATTDSDIGKYANAHAGFTNVTSEFYSLQPPVHRMLGGEGTVFVEKVCYDRMAYPSAAPAYSSAAPAYFSAAQAYPSAAPAYPPAAPAYPPAQAGGGISYAPAPAPGTHYAGGFAAQPALPNNNPYVNTPAFSTRPVYPPRDTSRSDASAPPAPAPAPNPALAAAEHDLIVAQSGVHDSSMLVDMLGKELAAHETVVESRKRQLAAAIADHDRIEAKLAASIAALKSAEAAVAAAFTVIDNVEDEQKAKERAEIEAAIAQVAKLEAREKEEREAREAAEAIARVALAEQSEAAAAEKAAADARERSLQAEMQQAMEQALEAEMQAAMAASIAAMPVAVHVPAAAPVVAQPSTYILLVTYYVTCALKTRTLEYILD